jgi:DNA-directed RNA polymerase sigma subunit (sigma70/sigma32)
MTSDASSWQFDHARDIIPSKVNPLYVRLVCPELANGGYFTKEAERNAFCKLKALKDAGMKKEYLETFSLIFKYNMGLVFKAVGIFKENFKGVSIEELISEGTLILVRGIEKYDTSFSNKFSSYCYLGIIRALRRVCYQPMDKVYQEIDNLDSIMPCNQNVGENLKLSEMREQINNLSRILNERDRNLLFEYYGLTKTIGKFDSTTKGRRRRRVHLILRMLQLHVKKQLIEKCV